MLLLRVCWKGYYEFSNSLKPTCIFFPNVAFLTFPLACLILNFICSKCSFIPSPPLQPPFPFTWTLTFSLLRPKSDAILQLSDAPRKSIIDVFSHPPLHCFVPGRPSLTWTVAVASYLAPALTLSLVQATVTTLVWIKQIMSHLCSNPRTSHFPQRKRKGFFLRHKGWHDLVTSLTLSPPPSCSFLSSPCGTTMTVILTAPPLWPLQ